MIKRIVTLLLAVQVFLAIPLTASALGLDVTVQAGGGAAMGTTDDENKSGKLRWAVGGGVAIDLFLLELNQFTVGVSSGTDYSLLNYYGETVGIEKYITPLTTDRVSESRYNYLNIPFALVLKLDLNEKFALNVRAGGFAGYFIDGKVDNTYTLEVPSVYVNGEVDLDDTLIEQWQFGLRFSFGLDALKKGKICFSPSIQFDIGLTDTSVDFWQPRPSNDTFWALTANLGIKYSVF